MAKVKLTPTRKKILLGVVASLLIVAVGILALIKFVPSGEEEEYPEPSINEIGLEAAMLAENDDAEGVLDYYDRQLEDAQDEEEKKVLLVMKSRAAQGSKSWGVAVDAAKQADSMGSDGMTMRTLADAYAASGDNEQALVYYKKLLEMYPDSDTATGRGPSLSEIIEGLEQ